MTHHLLTKTVLALLAASAANPVDAAVRYLGTRSVGAGSVDLSVETNGRMGVLTAADFLAWSVTLRDPTAAFPLRTLTNDGANGTVRSRVVVGGTAVSATSTAMVFDYGSGDLEFDADFTARPFYQLVSTGCGTGYFGETRACEQFDTGSDYLSQHVQYSLHADAGAVVLATAAAVPEPASWALMVVGFGFVGILRRVAVEVGGRGARPAAD